MLPKERQAFFEAAEKLSPIEHAFLRFTYETASRVTETLHATWAMIDRTNRVAKVPRLKGSGTGIAPISKRLLVLLQESSPPKKNSKLFPGDSSCTDSTEGKTKRGKHATDVCPSGHLSRFWAHDVCGKAGKAARIHPGLRHPHVLKHTRLSDVARHYRENWAAAKTALMQISGHRRAESLLIYTNDPEEADAKMGAIRDELEEV